MLSRKRKGTPANNKRECKCIKHAFLTHDTAQKRIHNVSSKDYSKSALNYLKSKGLFGKECKYVCDVCINYALQKLQSDKNVELPLPALDESVSSVNMSEGELMDISSIYDDVMHEGPVGDEAPALDENEENGNTRNAMIDAVDFLIEKIGAKGFQSDELLNRKLTELIHVIARTIIQPKITEHCKELNGQYRDVEVLQTLNSEKFISSVSPFITRFLSGCSGKAFSSISDTKVLFRIAVVIESIYHIKNSNAVLPHSFAMNLTQRQISGSKTVAVVNGKVLPGASDSVLRDWWEVQGSQPLETPRNGDIVFGYDNVGKYIVPSFRVKGERNTTPTVVTATQCIEMTPATTPPSELQNQPTYRTSLADEEESAIQVRMLEIREEGVNDFRHFRYQFICAIFQHMLASAEMEYMISSEIEKLKNDILTRECTQCGALYPARKRKCDVCEGCVVNCKSADERYENFKNPLPKYLDVGQEGVRNPVKIITAEPIMKNPNSFENIEYILDEIENETINEDDECGRNWLFVCADGPPACLMRRIKKNDPEKYKWLAILSGKGHLQMNMMKGLCKFGNKVCLNVLGQDVLKYDTLKSYNYFIQCKDTHKSYQALEIFLIGTCMELIRVYGAETNTPTPLGFLEWTSLTKNSIVKFMSQYVLNFVLAMYIHRIGERYNDFKCSNAGRMKFFDLFYALNHPIYREIEYNDLRERAISTVEVNELRKRNTSYANEDGEFNFNHQDSDFKLEERVRTMKRLSPKGKMDKTMWKRVARGMDNVNKAVAHCKHLLKIDNDEATRMTPVDSEIVKYRAKLRSLKYFSNEDDYFQNMDGDKSLNPILKDFTSVVAQKREEFFALAQSSNLENIRYDVLSPFGEDCTSDLEDSEEDEASDQDQ